VTGCLPSDQRLRGQSVEENAEQDGKSPNQFQLGRDAGGPSTPRWMT
jgi:hypothetical protein